jgi:tetratricopeptide (TPR) repeat protein
VQRRDGDAVSMACMNRRANPAPTGLRALIERLMEDDSFPRAGATLAANQVLLTAEADDELAALVAQATQCRDDDRAVAISQLRAFVGRCRRTGLAAVFLPDHPDIDPVIVSIVGTDMRAADDAEGSYDRTGDIDALTAAAAAWRRVMTDPSLVSAYPGLRAALLNNGGGVLLRRYWAVGSRDDLAGAYEVLRTAVALTPPHVPLIVGRLCNLGLAIREIYRQNGDRSALERAIGAFERAAEVAAQVAAAQPSAAPAARTNLALGLQDRYLSSGDPDDLARAIGCCEQACWGAEPVSACVMLGDLLRRRYESTGERPDLTRAVALLRGALQATPPRSPERPRRLVDLGIALLDQHAESGDPGDLSTALQLFDEAVQAIPATSPDRPGCLVHRSLAFYRRYESAGALDDLDRAVDGLDEAVRTAGAGCVDTAGWTIDLAAVLHERARRTGAHQDLNWAICLLEAASAPESDTFGNRYVAMNDLGNALRDRYHSTGQGPDLDRAIQVLRAALAAAPTGSAQSATLRANLGVAQRDRHAATRSPADLDEASAHLRAAVELSPAGNTDRARRLFALALAARDRYAVSGQEADLDTAIDAYRRGCADGIMADPPSTLAAAQEWGAWATARRSWSEAATGYHTAIDAMLAVVHSQVIREHQENWLRDTAGLPGRAAYASAMAHQLQAAVAAAEAGRAAILTETLQRDNLDLRMLAGHCPDLADRYTRAANRLRAAQQQRPAPRLGP